MFNLNNYPDILTHVRLVSRVCRPNSAGWIECFCPYCDDATRKFNPKDGHFYLANKFTFAHCFRCGTKVGLDKYLTDTGYKNVEVINIIRQLSGFVYNTSKSKLSLRRQNIQTIDNTNMQLRDLYSTFRSQNPVYFKKFMDYIYMRCLDIDPRRFFLIPFVYQNSVQVRFLNYDGQLVTARNIDKTKGKYNIKGVKNFYYFQDITKIDEYDSIIVTEGAFDLINLSNFYLDFKESFFIAIGGNNYRGMVADLINSFLLIGKYKIKVVFDSGIKFLDRIIKSIQMKSNELNPQIVIEFYQPINSKDVSELMLLEQIS